MAITSAHTLRRNARFASTLYVSRSRLFSVATVARLAVRLVFASLIAALLYSVGSSMAQADPVGGQDITRTKHSLADIRAAAERFVLQRSDAQISNATLIVTAAELDSRLQLDQCAGELDSFALNGAAIAARLTVGVRCNQGANWTVYVPVNVESEMDVAVLRNSMPREAHVASGDLDMQRRRIPGFGSAYITHAASLRDQHLKRALPAGTVLQADMLARDLVVKRGQQVLLQFATHGLVIQAPGLALADGGTADRIRVQNQTSLKVVEGIVESGNLVRVGM